jgi:hypothetical protein
MVLKNSSWYLMDMVMMNAYGRQKTTYLDTTEG